MFNSFPSCQDATITKNVNTAYHATIYQSVLNDNIPQIVLANVLRKRIWIVFHSKEKHSSESWRNFKAYFERRITVLVVFVSWFSKTIRTVFTSAILRECLWQGTVSTSAGITKARYIGMVEHSSQAVKMTGWEKSTKTTRSWVPVIKPTEAIHIMLFFVCICFGPLFR